MKDLGDLNRIERAVLLACCDANKDSKGSHAPIEAIKRSIKNLNQKQVRKVIKTLISSGFIREHPTRGGVTYNLNKKGIIACQTIREEDQ